MLLPTEEKLVGGFTVLFMLVVTLLLTYDTYTGDSREACPVVSKGEE